MASVLVWLPRAVVPFLLVVVQRVVSVLPSSHPYLIMRTIKSKQDFDRVFTSGDRYSHPLVRMTICDAANKSESGRVAFVAAKRLGCAVVRNRSKRVLRVAAQSCCLPIQHKDIILFATHKTRTASPVEMERAVRFLLKKAGVVNV